MNMKTLLLLVSLVAAARLGAAAEPANVPGFTPVAANEHPRLFFRKADGAALRAKAQTPEGQQIVARLKATLGGGEALPTVESPLKAAYENSVKLPEGAWTISTPMGFGMLWQLTGNRKYADLAFAALERGWAGARDRDSAGRYSLTTVDEDGALRAGPIFGFVAMAYDLSYDGWDEAKRAKVRDWLLKGELTSANAKAGKLTVGVSKFRLPALIEKPAHHPASNHWGAHIGGAGLAVLALQGDSGVDAATTAQWNAKLRDGLKKCLTAGFGDHGFFSEGQGPSHVGSNSSLLMYLQALRVAAGEDWTGPDSPGAWLTLRWVMETTTTPEGTAIYPIRDELFGSAYGTPRWWQMNGSVTHGGWFSQGFGALPKADGPALLWTYHHVAAHDDVRRFDSLNYPHRAALALINWPIGAAEVNPATRLPRVIADKLHGYYVLRSGWKDATDVIATLYSCRGPAPYGKWPKQNLGVKLIANGIQHTLAWPLTVEDPTVLRWDEQGGAIAFPNGFALGVFPGAAAGCDAVVVRTGNPDGAQGGPVGEVFDQSASLAGARIAICTLSVSGVHPQAVAEGADAVRLGGLVVRLAGGVPVFAADGRAGGETIDAFAAKKLPRPVPLKEEDIVLPKDPALAYSFDPATLVEKDGQLTAAPVTGNAAQTAWLRDIAIVPGVRGAAIHCGAKGVGIIPPGTGHGMSQAGLSISFWFKLDAPVDGYGLFMENSPGYGGLGKYQIGWHPGPVLNFSGYGAFDVPFGNEAGRWYHFCTVVDPKTRQLIGYIDGQPVVRAAAAPGPSAPQPLYLFGRGRDLERAANLCNNAALDELRFFPRPLTPGEVMALYRDGATPAAAGHLPPVARFTTSAPATLAGREITFDASASVDVEGVAVTYAWDFGDGSSGSGIRVKHAYAKDGHYAVKLTVRDGQGGAGQATQGVQIANRPPIARLTQSLAGNKLVFDASGSVDPDGGELKATWQPAPVSVAGMKATYDAPATGVLKVVCTLTDPQGGSAAAVRLIARPGADGVLPATETANTWPGLHVNTGVLETELALAGNGSQPVDEQHFVFQYWTTTPDLDWRRVAQRSIGTVQAWYGYLTVPAAGQWTFGVHGRQGAALWVDGNYVGGGFNRFKAGQPAEATVGLAKGLHRIRALMWAAAAGSDPTPYFYGSFEWAGPGVARRYLQAGDFRRSPSPWENGGQIGEDLAEAWNVAVPGTLGTVSGNVSVAGNLVTLAVPAEEHATVAWSTGQGRVVAGKQIVVPAAAGRYVATARVTDPDGAVRVAVVPYEVPAPASGRSIGLRLFESNGFFGHERFGCPAQLYWNTRTKESVPLRDSTGAVTTCVAGGFKLGGEPPRLPAGALEAGMEGVFMTGGVALGSLELTGIPYAKYEVRVYWNGVPPGQTPAKPPEPVAVFRCGGKTVKLRYDWDRPSFVDRYIVVDDGQEASGNMARFRDLTGPAQTITLEKMPVKRFGVVGVQIVEIP